MALLWASSLLLLVLQCHSSPLPDASPVPVENAAAACTTYLRGDDFRDYDVTTIYAVTRTVYTEVDCDGCVLATPTWGLGSPRPPLTITARGTSTVTKASCAPTEHPGVGFDPCIAAQCPTGSNCTVRDGRAICVRRGGGGMGGARCGSKVCTSGLVCCNSSCGICAPPNGACIQLFCGTSPTSDLELEEPVP